MADAVRVWSSSGSNDLDLAANWGGTTPVVGDIAVFPRGNPHSALEDMTGFNFKLKELNVRREYTGDIGSNGNPIVTAAALAWFRSNGNVYYENIGTADTDVLIVDMADPEAVVNIDGDECTNVVVMRGRVTISGVVVNLEVGYHSNPSGDANVTVETGATITNILQSGGMVDCKTAVARWSMSSGLAKQDVATVTNLDILGGRMLYNHSALTTVRIHKGGVLDTSHLTKKLTIGTAFIHSKVGLIYPAGSDLVTITNHYQLDLGDN